jgi:hypothetical protein
VKNAEAENQIPYNINIQPEFKISDIFLIGDNGQ